MAGFVSEPGGAWKIFPASTSSQTTNGRGGMTYGQFTKELEERNVDTSGQQFGVSGWFQEVQAAGGDFGRYLELVGCQCLPNRISHADALAKLKDNAERT